MKRSKSPYLNDSKTFQCITRFQLIPPNMVAKENPLFSAFSKTKLKKHLTNEVQQARNNKTDNLINEIKFNDNSSKKSLLLGRGQAHNNILEGVLRARKSHMKKLKLKQFYLEEYGQETQRQIEMLQQIGSIEFIDSKNSTQFNTIESKQLSTAHNNFLSNQKKKILPIKLRAKSSSNIPRSVKYRTFDTTNNQNSLLIRPKKNMSFHHIQKKISNDNQPLSQNSFHINPRRKLRSQGRKKYQKLVNQRTILGDVSLKLNEVPQNVLFQKNDQQKIYQSIKPKKGLRSQYYSKANESIFEINGWGNNHNQEDKQNQLFVF